MTARLAGKTAVVTGAGSGIGEGCAKGFARHGATVIAVDLNRASLDTLKSELQSDGLDILTHATDLTDPAAVADLFEFVSENSANLDVLVNAAAVADFVWIEEMEFDQHWRRTIAGELDTVFLACKAAWSMLQASGNSAIVNLASANAYVALKNSPALAHTAGKGGVLAMTRQLAMEGGPHGIRANSISPGMIVTPATEPALERPELLQSVWDKLMVNRLGTPEDIAHMAVFLASDEAGYITGADFRVDGGALAW